MYSLRRCFLVAILNDSEYVCDVGRLAARACARQGIPAGRTGIRVRLQTDRCVVKKLDMGRMKGTERGREGGREERGQSETEKWFWAQDAGCQAADYASVRLSRGGCCGDGQLEGRVLTSDTADVDHDQKMFWVQQVTKIVAISTADIQERMAAQT